MTGIRPTLELHAQAEEDLPGVAVEGGHNALAAERGRNSGLAEDRRGRGHRQNRRSGHRVDVEELVARGDVLLVGDVLGMEADRIALVAAPPDEEALASLIGKHKERGGSFAVFPQNESVQSPIRPGGDRARMDS